MTELSRLAAQGINEVYTNSIRDCVKLLLDNPAQIDEIRYQPIKAPTDAYLRVTQYPLSQEEPMFLIIKLGHEAVAVATRPICEVSDGRVMISWVVAKIRPGHL